MDQKKILAELKDIEASAALLQQRSYRLIKGLESGGSSASRKGLDPNIKARIIAKRRKTVFK